MLVRIIEGLSGDLRRAPKDEENLIAAAATGWVTALDNLSRMTPDLSDAMCCIVTGAESVKRALFTDGDVFRARYRRLLLLTGIDAGVIRPGLAERLLPLRLERPRVRRTEAWRQEAVPRHDQEPASEGDPIPLMCVAPLRWQRLRQGARRDAIGADWHDSDHVFTTRSGRPIEPRNLYRSFLRIAASAGLPQGSPAQTAPLSGTAVKNCRQRPRGP